MRTIKPHGVVEGQQYQSCDSRRTKTVRVLKVYEEEGTARIINVQNERTSQIKLNRLNSHNGYKLVPEVGSL